MDFYQVLLEIMDEKSFSIPDVARVTGLSDSTIRSIISRKTKKVSLDVAFKMYKGLGVSLERLNGEEIKDNTKNNNLSQEETTLLENYNKLDTEDKNKVVDYTKLLSNQDKYKVLDNTTDEITATTDNVIKLNTNDKKEDYEEVFVPYKSLDEAGKTIAAHDDDLTDEEKAVMDKIILDDINEERLKEWRKKHNK